MDELRTIKPLILAAGQILRDYFSKGFSINYKGPRDLVTEADVAVEQYLRTALDTVCPGVAFIGEESGMSLQLPSCFILDPLDGTTNFAHGVPAFCISLARLENAEITWGMIYDPIRDELFSAARGAGAFLNGQSIAVTGETGLRRALLATGFPYADDTVARSLNYFNHVLPHCQGIRRVGAAALDLAYTACGRFDGFFELNLKPWDVAAGIAIVREAGGKATDLAGSPSTPYDGNIVASNSAIHAELLSVIDRAQKNYPAFAELYDRMIHGTH